MPVKVTAAVWRQLDRQENWLSLLVKTRVPRAEAARALSEVVQAMGESAEEVDELATLTVRETSRGPGLAVRDLVPYDAQRVLDRVGELLAERGIDEVSFTTMPTVNVEGRDWQQAVHFKVWMQFAGHRPAGWRLLGWKEAHWVMSDEDREAGLDYLIDWALRIPGRGAIASLSLDSRDPYLEVPLSDFPQAVQAAARAAGPNDDCLASVHTPEGRSRRLDIRIGRGMAAASDGHLDGSGFDWREDVDHAAAFMADTGSWCSWAHLVRAPKGGVYASDSDNCDRSAPSAMWLHRPYGMLDLPEMGKVYDAFGIMRMTTDLAQRLVLEPLWSTQPTADGHVLATHTDLAGWYAENRINDEFIDRARAQLGDALIDRFPEAHRDV